MIWTQQEIKIFKKIRKINNKLQRKFTIFINNKNKSVFVLEKRKRYFDLNIVLKEFKLELKNDKIKYWQERLLICMERLKGAKTLEEFELVNKEIEILRKCRYID